MTATVSESPRFLARHRYARITARKARLVADLIRGRAINSALELLELAPQRAAVMYAKVVRSAMANASQDETVDLNRLVIVDARADDGPMLQGRMRWRAGPQGRAMPFKKVTSHLTVVLTEASDAPAGRRKKTAAKGSAEEPAGARAKRSRKKKSEEA